MLDQDGILLLRWNDHHRGKLRSTPFWLGQTGPCLSERYVQDTFPLFPFRTLSSRVPAEATKNFNTVWRCWKLPGKLRMTVMKTTSGSWNAAYCAQCNILGKWIKNFGTRKVEVLNNLIMKITAKAIDVNDIFVNVLVTPVTIIRTSQLNCSDLAASSYGQSKHFHSLQARSLQFNVPWTPLQTLKIKKCINSIRQCIPLVFGSVYQNV